VIETAQNWPDFDGGIVLSIGVRLFTRSRATSAARRWPSSFARGILKSSAVLIARKVFVWRSRTNRLFRSHAVDRPILEADKAR
jgi:hypothetical protein